MAGTAQDYINQQAGSQYQLDLQKRTQDEAAAAQAQRVAQNAANLKQSLTGPTYMGGPNNPAVSGQQNQKAAAPQAPPMPAPAVPLPNTTPTTSTPDAGGGAGGGADYSGAANALGATAPTVTTPAASAGGQPIQALGPDPTQPGFIGATAGALRPFLGTRTMPQYSNALTALKTAY